MRLKGKNTMLISANYVERFSYRILMANESSFALICAAEPGGSRIEISCA
jgi:hypothetical protein